MLTNRIYLVTDSIETDWALTAAPICNNCTFPFRGCFLLLRLGDRQRFETVFLTQLNSHGLFILHFYSFLFLSVYVPFDLGKKMNLIFNLNWASLCKNRYFAFKKRKALGHGNKIPLVGRTWHCDTVRVHLPLFYLHCLVPNFNYGTKFYKQANLSGLVHCYNIENDRNFVMKISCFIL